MNAQQEYLPVSQLNKYVFCPRRFYYEYVLGEWADNAHTVAGTYRHERAHTPGRESRGEQAATRSVTVFSDRLRIVGKLDVLEERSGVLLPVEYKSGAGRDDGPWRNDAVQLCALALCLEERTGLSIPRGALFTFADRERTNVAFDDALRAETEQVIAAAHATAASAEIPPPVYSRRCEGCSLKSHCLPQEVTRLRESESSKTELRALAREALRGA